MLIITHTMSTQLDPTMAEAHIYGNILTLKVNNILKGWPTYVIKFTPEKPGPVTCILTHPLPLLGKDMGTGYPPWVVGMGTYGYG